MLKGQLKVEMMAFVGLGGATGHELCRCLVSLLTNVA